MTPWELAKDSEHSHQRALFAWMNCAALYGFDYADNHDAYSMLLRDNLQFKGFGLPKPVPALRFAFAIHNQGHGDAIRGNRARAEGVKKGAPDLMLPIVRFSSTMDSGIGMGEYGQYAGLFIEMKKPNQRPKVSGAGGVKAAQSEYHEFLIAQGYRVEVCYSWREAADVVKSYLA